MTLLGGEALQQRCLEAVVEEGTRVGDLARDLEAGRTPAHGGLGTPVPWVPEWTAGDLVGHLGTVHRWATAIVRARHTEAPQAAARQTPPAEGLLDWYAVGLEELVTMLRDTPPDAPAWHMSPAARQVAASWVRRQAHELLVHRCDMEVAAGVPHAPIDPALAEDGVDELLAVVVPRWAHTEPLSTADATVAVTVTDTGRSWSVGVLRGAVSVVNGRSGTEKAHLQGPAAELLLHLWGRPATVTVDGDASAEALLRGR